MKIFDVESEYGECKCILSGHNYLIHDMHWSANDNYLVTASGDGSAKVWKLHDKDKQVNDHLNYTENDVKFLLCKPLMHPSFVYSAQIHPDASNGTTDQLILATACFDQKVRIWACNTMDPLERNYPMCIHELSIMDRPLQTMAAKQSIYEADQLDDEALALIMRPELKVQYKGAGGKVEEVTTTGTIFDQVHPNCLKFSDAGRLFVGDSRGRISVWDISLRHRNITAENHFKITHKELDGD